MAHEGGGGGRPNNPYSGPIEQKLLRVLDARIDTLYAAARHWTGARETLDGVTSQLETDRKALAAALGANSQTARSAAAAYQTVQTSMEARSTDLQKGYDALEASAQALSTAQSACYDLGPMPCDPNSPDSDLERLLDPGGMLRRARHDGEVRAREAKAQAALDTLDQQLDESARGFAGVAGEPVPDYSGGGSSRSTGGSALPSGSSTPGSVATVTPGSATADHVTTTPPRGTDPQQPHVPVPGGPGSTMPGDASGGPEITTPGQSTPVGGSSGTGSTAPTGVGAGAAAVGALGAGAVSGAGSVAAAGRGAGAMRGMLPGTSAGAIGKSTTSATRGALGRTPMVPGPTTTAPTTRGGAQAGARGPLAGAGAGSGQTGKGGSRGTAGGRGGPLPAAATGGSRGKRDKDREREADHLVIDDEQSWLDDEGVTDPVID